MLEWIDGRTMSNEAFVAAGMPARIAATLRLLHAGPPFRDAFDMFRLSERYLRLVDEGAIAIPAGYRAHLAAIPTIEAALARHPLPAVPCHNDLLADNYLDDGTRLWIVDFEYSGNERSDVRARQHLPGARLRRPARRPSYAPPTSARPPRPSWPGCDFR